MGAFLEEGVLEEVIDLGGKMAPLMAQIQSEEAEQVVTSHRRVEGLRWSHHETETRTFAVAVPSAGMPFPQAFMCWHLDVQDSAQIFFH